MAYVDTMKDKKSRSDKLKDPVRQGAAGPDEKRWEQRLRRVAKVAREEPQGEPREVAKRKPGKTE